jgi:DNA-binding transcriptional MerR regulator
MTMTNKEKVSVPEKLLSSGELARELGIKRYQLEYMLEMDKLPDTPMRVAGKRIWSPAVVAQIKEILRQKKILEVNEQENKS